jgi:dihydropyrimidinase
VGMILSGGTVVTPEGAVRTDVRIADEKIHAVGPRLGSSTNADTTIDVSGLIVLPGGVDVHTHLDLDAGIARSSDDWYTGTVAAACGGTTTVVDHPAFGPSGCSVFHQIDVYHGLADRRAVIDYGFHGVIQHVDEQVIGDLAGLVERGVTSSKVYLTYDFRLSDRAVLQVLEKMKALGGITAFHCENHGIVSHYRKTFASEGHTTPEYHARSRPHTAEAEAIARVIRLAETVGDVPVYIVHLSTASGLEEIRWGRERGVPVFAETCPQYLLLDEDEYEKPGLEGLKAVMSPPLRTRADREALWGGLADRTIQVVGTDHCPFDFAQKRRLGGESFLRCPNGAPGIEARMPLLFSEGVAKGRITLARLSEITALHPAKIMGLYPSKGAIEPGADADLVVFDPERRETISHSLLHERVDYTPYEGIEVRGYPVMTLLRGKIIVQNGVFSGDAGSGSFVYRQKPTLSPVDLFGG